MNIARLSPAEARRRSIELLENRLRSPDVDPTPWNLFAMLEHQASNAGWTLDWRSTLEHWGELTRTGAVAVLGNGDVARQYHPLFVVTKRGKAMLERGAESPHHEDRYILAIIRRVDKPDSIAIEYVTEAIRAWKANLTRASIVMLGCACERLIILLAEHVMAVGVSPFSAKLQKLLSGPANISNVFTLVRDALDAAASDKRLPPEYGPDMVDRAVTPVFERARRLRNVSGHPTGEVVHPEDAEAGLLLFPAFHEFVSLVIRELKPKT